MKIVIASDHTGYELRQEMADEAREPGHGVVDLGPAPGEKLDYPVNGAAVGRLVAKGEYDLGMLVCGTGVGISLAANKIRGIRAVVCSEPYRRSCPVSTTTATSSRSAPASWDRDWPE